jgi:hypothetical protein
LDFSHGQFLSMEAEDLHGLVWPAGAGGAGGRREWSVPAGVSRVSMVP